MNGIQEFLLEASKKNLRKKFIVSERLKDHPFTIRAMTSEENRRWAEVCTKRHKGTKETDYYKFYGILISECVLEPCFKDAEWMTATGVKTSRQLIETVLLPGEIAALSKIILDFAGFDQDFEHATEEAKND